MVLFTEVRRRSIFDRTPFPQTRDSNNYPCISYPTKFSGEIDQYLCLVIEDGEKVFPDLEGEKNYSLWIAGKGIEGGLETSLYLIHQRYKYVISGGAWIEFVKELGLVKGDVVMFQCNVVRMAHLERFSRGDGQPLYSLTVCRQGVRLKSADEVLTAIDAVIEKTAGKQPVHPLVVLVSHDEDAKVHELIKSDAADVKSVAAVGKAGCDKWKSFTDEDAEAINTTILNEPKFHQHDQLIKSVAAVGKAGGDKWKSFTYETGVGGDDSDKSKSKVGKAGGYKWKFLTDEEKAHFQAEAEKHKAEYERKLEAFNRKLAGGGDYDKCESEVNDEHGSDDEEE